MRDRIPAIVVDAFTAATETMFAEMCQTVVIPRESFWTESVSMFDRVLAEIPMLGLGRLVLAFPAEVLNALVGRYLVGCDLATPGLVEDAAGEFANVVAGQAKTMLKGTPHHFQLATPRVGAAVAPLTGGSGILVLPFDSDAGEFSVMIRFE